MLRTWVGEHRPRASRARTAAAAGIVAVMVVLATSTGPIDPRARSSPSPSTAGTTGGTSQPAPSGAAQPGTWEAIDLAPYEPVADLVPDGTDGSRISPRGSFTLRSLTATPAVELAAGLRTEPALELIVEPGASVDVATVRPARPLAEDARYRFRLHAPDGSLAADWTFRTGGPLHVVGTMPHDQATQVPLDTGIEIEFDQDGVTDVARHFTIEPEVPGRFEAHGRTSVFVPASNLVAGTLYRVTVTRGVGLQGSDQILEADELFAFETLKVGERDDEPRIVFDRPLFEVPPGEAPVIPVIVWNATDDAPITRRMTLYQVDTLELAMSAAESLSTDLGWAQRSSTGSVPVEDLTEVLAFDATIAIEASSGLISLPDGLARGWYLLDVPQAGRHAQLLIQVTDIAVYALTSSRSTVAWVNDLVTSTPIGDAAVSLYRGSALGQTNAAGLLEIATPDALGTSHPGATEHPLLLVSARDGRNVIAPLAPDRGYYSNPLEHRWWQMLGTDRNQYRQTDTIHAWGLVRARTDRSVPRDVELRLLSAEAASAPIATVRVRPTALGVIVADLPIRSLPPGHYSVALFVEGERVTSAAVQVTDLRKPAFSLDVSTDRRAYIHGETIEVRTAAAFYDGTAAPGMSLVVDASAVSGDDGRTVKADATGTASFTFRAAAADGNVDYGSINARPAQPEEGAISGRTSFVVFPSTAWLSADATLEVGSLRVDGRLSRVDLAAAGKRYALDGSVEEAGGGGAMAGRTVSVSVDRVTWTAIQSGTTYDFLEKRTVPRFRYERVVTAIGTFRPTTAGDGSFAVRIPADTASGAFEVTLTAMDEEGRRIRRHTFATTATGQPESSTFPYLEEPADCGYATPTRRVGTGQPFSLTLRDGDGTPLQAGPTLYLVGRLGIDEAMVTSASTLERIFEDNDLPSLTVRAIRLTTAGYVVTNDMTVLVADGDRAIDVEIAAGRPRYAPGEEAEVTITTARPDGTPIAADVIVQAIDLKLFAIGAASEIDTSALMYPVSDGFGRSYASHPVPRPLSEGCGGATSGGGEEEPRADFRDLATFQLIATDEHGHASTTFELPDDLTSWVVSATAVASGLETGTGSIEVPVGLPFFVDATIAPEYLAEEEPTVKLRAYGAGLVAGDPVRFTFAAPSLGLAATTIEGRAFEPVSVAVPALRLGDHEVTISAEQPGSDPQLRDSISRTVRVVPTRLRTLQTAIDPMTGSFAPPGGDGMTTFTVTDAGRGALVGLLRRLSWGSSARLDAILAAEMARELLTGDFGVDESRLPASGFAGSQAIGSEGLALLPYGSPDLILTAKAALVAADRFPASNLREPLRSWADAPTVTRERRIAALAGLAGLGEDVIRELRGFIGEDLTIREALWLGLGLVAAGDEDAARAIERSILETHGRRFGQWVRLEAAVETPETAEANALVLLLAARLRDPIAGDLSSYLLDNPSSEGSAVLEQVGYARAALEWLPRTEARFAWTVDGQRHEETLELGRPFTMALTADQRRTLQLDALEGDLVVASAWAGEARYDTLPADPMLRIERSVTPPADAPSDDMVRVILTVSFEGRAPAGCYQVTDLVPSGLAPVVTPIYGWGVATDVRGPYEVEGQRVSWCIGTDERVVRLGYAARVVSAGTYRWEPAVIQSAAAPSVGAATSVMSYTIR